MAYRPDIKLFKIREQLAIRRFRLSLKKKIDPTEDFLKKNRVLFLEKLKEQSAGRANAIKTEKTLFGLAFISPVSFARRFAAVSLVFILFFGAALLYSESKKAGPENYLYGLKRLSENIQIQLATSKTKPFLHDEFAKRRLEELQKTSKPEGVRFSRLNDDLYHELRSAIIAANNGKIDKKQTLQLCNSLLAVINEYEKISVENFEKLKNLKSGCQEFIKQNK